MSITANASVMDVNRQAWASTATLLVHPADLYVGLRSDRYFVSRGTPLKVDVIVTDLDGAPVIDRPVEVRAARLEWKVRGDHWQEEEVDVQTCTVGSSSEPVTCTFETPIGGTVRITAAVTDLQGRRNQSQITRWVSGGELPPARKVEQEQVTLIPDKETYQPGEMAQILVQAPFSQGEGLLTVSRSGLLYTLRFTIKEGSATLSVPIQEQHIPNLSLQVDVVGSAPRTDDRGELVEDVLPRPAFATAQLNLSIPPLQRALALTVTPAQSELEPGGETSLLVVLRDAQGQPVPDAELSVVVVDEAILALTSYQLLDPLKVFYAERPSYLNSVYARSSIVLVDPRALSANARQAGAMDAMTLQSAEAMPAMAPAATEGAMARGEAKSEESGGETAPIRVRSDFNPLAVFAPSVRTDPNGEARWR